MGAIISKVKQFNCTKTITCLPNDSAPFSSTINKSANLKSLAHPQTLTGEHPFRLRQHPQQQLKGDEPSTSDDESTRLHRERRNGQALLREMVSSGDSNGNQVDWAAVIAKADQLHAREQALLRKKTSKQGGVVRHKLHHNSEGITITGVSRKYRKRRFLRPRNPWNLSSVQSRESKASGTPEMHSSRLAKIKKRELRKRRRNDIIGSFSVNMVTVTKDGEIRGLGSASRSIGTVASTAGASSTPRSSNGASINQNDGNSDKFDCLSRSAGTCENNSATESQSLPSQDPNVDGKVEHSLETVIESKLFSREQYQDYSNEHQGEPHNYPEFRGRPSADLDKTVIVSPGINDSHGESSGSDCVDDLDGTKSAANSLNCIEKKKESNAHWAVGSPSIQFDAAASRTFNTGSFSAALSGNIDEHLLDDGDSSSCCSSKSSDSIVPEKGVSFDRSWDLRMAPIYECAGETC